MEDTVTRTFPPAVDIAGEEGGETQVAVVESYTTEGETTMLPNLQRRVGAVKPVPETVTEVPPVVVPVEGEMEEMVVAVENVKEADVVERDDACSFVDTARE